MTELTPVPPAADPSAPLHGAADWEVGALTAARLAASVPANTRRAYLWVWDGRTDPDAEPPEPPGGFLGWCTAAGRIALPATGPTLTEYVSTLITADRAPATIEQAIGAIRALHKLAGHRDQPATDDALRLLRLHRRVRAENGRGQRQAIPFTPATLRQAVAALDTTTLRGRRDRLLLVFGFTTMARRSELAALTLADVAETPDGLEVTVRTSKTDKQSQGSVRALPPGGHPDTDPVRLHAAWRADLVARAVTAGPLLPRFRRGDHPTAAPLSGAAVNEIVKAAARAAALPDPDRYTGHSLRAGGLTAALRNGAPLGIAARHGGWDPESPVAARYARAADRWRDNAMAGVL